jgi:15-cis-phytoene desaturase
VLELGKLIPSPLEWVSITNFFVRGMADYFRRPRELDQISVGEYARKHGVSDRAIERILVPLTAGIFFLPPERYSTYALFGLIGPYLSRLYKTRVGSFRGGMTEVMALAIAQAIEGKRGAALTGR